jgi:hypothetical protein
VSRFRSSHHYAARSLANFGIKGTPAIYDSSAVFGFEVPTRTRGYNDRNFKSTALRAASAIRAFETARLYYVARRFGSVAAGRVRPTPTGQTANDWIAWSGDTRGSRSIDRCIGTATSDIKKGALAGFWVDHNRRQSRKLARFDDFRCA